MDSFIQFINSPWVIGVGGGVLSGILVTLASRSVFSRKDRKEYAQKVMSANQEIVYAIRPGISESVLPTNDILEELMQATARKYGVARDDMYTHEELAQDLVKEVMDSSFISLNQKSSYCKLLMSLKSSVPLKQSSLEKSLEKNIAFSKGYVEYRKRMVATMSSILGLVVAVVTLIVTFYASYLQQEYTSVQDSAMYMLPERLPVTLLLVTTVTVMTFSLLLLSMLDTTLRSGLPRIKKKGRRLKVFSNKKS